MGVAKVKKKDMSHDDILRSKGFRDTNTTLLRTSNSLLYNIRKDELLHAIPTGKRNDWSFQMNKCNSDVVTYEFLKDNQKKRKSNYSSSPDWISQLPNDILNLILGFLPVEEAGRTSILSQRWQHVWKSSFLHMDFHKKRVLTKLYNMLDISMFKESMRIERSKYVSWVNRSLNSHKGLTLKAFRVCFDLDSEFSSDIDEWFNFALQKKVQWLAVELPTVVSDRVDCHPFPIHLFHENSNARFLTILKLSFVDVSQRSIKQLLHNCPLLKEILVSNAPNIRSLEICGESLKLKYLALIDCSRLLSLTISAPNLASLRYYTQREATLHLKNVPNLAALSFGELNFWYDRPDSYKLIAPSLSQLEALTLDSTLGDFTNFNYCNKFRKLKQLKLTVNAEGYQSLPLCNNLLKACPVLYKLIVRFKKISNGMWRSTFRSEHKFKSLKVLELHGFQGSTSHSEFAYFLCLKAVCYEEVTFDTREPVYGKTKLCAMEDGYMNKCRKGERSAKECARMFRDKFFATCPKFCIL